MQLHFRKDSPALEPAPRPRTGRTSCNCAASKHCLANAGKKLSRSVLIALDSWRFNLLEIQSPFHGLDLMAKLQKKKSVWLSEFFWTGGAFLGSREEKSHQSQQCARASVALLLSKPSLAPPSRWEFWVVF